MTNNRCFFRELPFVTHNPGMLSFETLRKAFIIVVEECHKLSLSFGQYSIPSSCHSLICFIAE